MQILDIFNYLSDELKIIFLFIWITVFILIYIDAGKRGLRGWLWACIIFMFPVILPVYILIRPKHYIAFCEKCSSILPEDGSECYYCHGEERIKEKSYLVIFKNYLIRFLLEVLKAYNIILAFCLFLFKKKFFMLNIKYLSYYPMGRSHQILATQGRGRGVSRHSLTYGETLFFTAWKIFALAEMKKDDVFYDIGCGTGPVVFFANILYDIEAVGIDIIPDFIENANKIKKELYFDKVTFIEGNFFDMDYSKGTVFYIAATALDLPAREKLSEKLKEAPKGARIVSITHILEGDHLKVIKKNTSIFTWGYEDLYLHVRL